MICVYVYVYVLLSKTRCHIIIYILIHITCTIYIYAHGQYMSIHVNTCQYMSIHESSTHVANLPLPVAKGALFWANPNHWDKVPRGRDLTPLLLNSDVFHMFPIVEYIP